MKSVELRLVVILPNSALDEVMDIACPVNERDEPEFTSLRGLIKAKLDHAEFEHVTVFWNDEYRDMFVDDTGVLKGLPINARATAIYWNNTRIHMPDDYDPETMAMIHGPAVLFDKKVWF
jgi:hypothetical protein